MTTLGLDRLLNRCTQGFAPVHHPTFCNCADLGEYVVFVSALKAATRADGTVHQADMRPLIRGRIEPKHVGTLYRRAKSDGLIREVDHERSDDRPGKNAGRLEPVYELRAA